MAEALICFADESEGKPMSEAWVICFVDGRYEGRYGRDAQIGDAPPYVATEAEAFKWHSGSQARAQADSYRKRGLPCKVLPCNA
jgi:hypothetical protein